MCKAMNELGVTEYCFGNHEFDIDYLTMTRRLKSLKGRLINSNIMFNERKIRELNAKLQPWETPKAGPSPAPSNVTSPAPPGSPSSVAAGEVVLKIDVPSRHDGDQISTPQSYEPSPTSTEHEFSAGSSPVSFTEPVTLTSLSIARLSTTVNPASPKLPSPRIQWRSYLTEETEANMVIASTGSGASAADLPFRIRPVLDAAVEHVTEIPPLVSSANVFASTAEEAPASSAAQGGSSSEHVDYAICLTHQYMPKDRQLAQLCPDFDLILGGHEHEPFAEIIGLDDDALTYARSLRPRNAIASVPLPLSKPTEQKENAGHAPLPEVLYVTRGHVADTAHTLEFDSFDQKDEEEKIDLVRAASTSSPFLRRRLSSAATSVAAEIYNINSPETTAANAVTPDDSEDPERKLWNDQRRTEALQASIESSGVSIIKAGSDAMYLAIVTVDFIHVPSVSANPEEVERFIHEHTEHGDMTNRKYLSKTIRRHEGSPFIAVTYMQMANIVTTKAKGLVAPSPVMVALAEEGKSIIAKQAGKVVYEVPPGAPMLSSKNVRSGPSTMATFLATRVREFFQCDLVMLPGGKVRGNKDYPDGKLTFVDILGELPFPDNQTVLVHIDGNAVEDTLRFSRVNYRGRGGFLHTDSETEFSDELGRLTKLAGVVITDENRDKVLNKCYWMACPITHLKGMDNLPGLKIAGCENGIEDLKNEEDLLLLQHIVMRSLSDNPQENRAAADEKLRATPALTPRLGPKGHIVAPPHCHHFGEDSLGLPADLEL